MPRVRFGVVMLVPPPLALEVDGLRRAFGSSTLDRIPVHLTLVPPVNVRVDDIPAALAVLRAAASTARPLELALGPPRTFDSSEGVVYLAVGGADDQQQALRRLQAAVLAGPLDRPIDHDFVPHVTLATGVGADRISVLLDAARDFRDVEVTIDRLHLLQEDDDRPHHWSPVADVPLGPAVVVGRGGLPVELTAGELVDHEALGLLARLRSPEGPPAIASRLTADVPDGARALVVVARREEAVVGLSEGWTAGPVAELTVVHVTDPADGTDDHLRAAWWSAAADRGAS
ncbi:MAG: 2'-5' RNA ligase family protein [Acidimicrobiales bacterium]